MKIISFIFLSIFCIVEKVIPTSFSVKIQDSKEDKIIGLFQMGNQKSCLEAIKPAKIGSLVKIMKKMFNIQQYTEGSYQNEQILLFCFVLCLCIIIYLSRMQNQDQGKIKELLFMNRDSKQFKGIILIRTRKANQLEDWLINEFLENQEDKKLFWFERYGRDKFIFYFLSNKKKAQLLRIIKQFCICIEQLKFPALVIQSKTNPFEMNLGQFEKCKRMPEIFEQYALRQQTIWVGIFNNHRDTAYMYGLLKHIPQEKIKIQWMQASLLCELPQQLAKQLVYNGIIEENRIFKQLGTDDYQILHHYKNKRFKKIFTMLNSQINQRRIK